MKKIVALTGAGISAESGISTFRDAGGLWEGHDIMEVASPEGFEKNPELVLDFYNKRRAQLKEVLPNNAHIALKTLELNYHVQIITQNVDDLHERAGSTNVYHLHGELRKVRSTKNPNLIYSWEDDLHLGDLCEENAQLRPHIVWFGEAVPMMEKAITCISDADIVLIIGTSMQVYPAAGLVGFAPSQALVYYIDPKAQVNAELSGIKNLHCIPKKATEGMKELLSFL